MAEKGRLVYSTGVGSICPECGSPVINCHCLRKPNEPVPDRVVAKLRLEKKGRGGKAVTVVDGLPDNAGFLKDLCQELKRVCGTGGTVDAGLVELQGDQRDRVRAILAGKGMVVKG